MNLRITLDLTVSPTMAETMKRGGFTVCPSGSGMQIQVPNAPAVPKHKVKIDFVSPTDKK